jgi:DNA mismatch endonuclease (patch repair protein)
MDMYDKKTRSFVMQAVKQRDTKPEMKVRKLLYHAGYRYRLHRKDLPGRPDIVFPRQRVAIFVHGCFWHQHSGCPRADRPTSNKVFWNKKLDRNVERDKANLEALTRMGWNVLIIWECKLKNDGLLDEIKHFLGDAR